MIIRSPGNPSMRASVVAVVAHRTLRSKDSISELVNMHSNDDGLADRSARRANQQIPVQPHSQKYFASPVGQIISTSSRHPVPRRGAYHDRHERWDGMRWTRQRFARDGIAGRVGERPVSDHQASGREMLQRTAKSCRPDASTLASSLAEARSAQPGWTKPSIRKATVAKEPDRRGARRKPLKPLRAGTSGDSGVLVVTRVRSTTTSAHEAAGATGIRRSPRPLWA